MPTVRRWTGAEACALRLALRLTVRGFAEYLGVAVRTVSKWEARGVTLFPKPDSQAVLDTALRRADADAQQRFSQLCHAGAAPVLRAEGRRRIATVAGDVRRRVGEASMTDGAVAVAESVELLGDLAESDLGPGVVDQLDEVVARLAAEYFTVAPADFRPRVLHWRRHVAALLHGRATLMQRRRLYAAAGRLTGLLAEASLALGADADEHCATALSLAEEAGDDALAGWVRGTQAQVALYAGDPVDAVDLAVAGQDVAPKGSAALVRACTYLARASARQGDRRRMHGALTAAEAAWASLEETTGANIFSLSRRYLPYCATTAFIWLGDPRSARACASDVTDSTGETTPTVGRAITRVDLAIALAQTSEAEEAAAIGMEAIDICAERLTIPARRRVTELLVALEPCDVSSVNELRERWAWISR